MSEYIFLIVHLCGVTRYVPVLPFFARKSTEQANTNMITYTEGVVIIYKLLPWVGWKKKNTNNYKTHFQGLSILFGIMV